MGVRTLAAARARNDENAYAAAALTAGASSFSLYIHAPRIVATTISTSPTAVAIASSRPLKRCIGYVARFGMKFPMNHTANPARIAVKTPAPYRGRIAA